jgi:hypothetical protein
MEYLHLGVYGAKKWLILKTTIKTPFKRFYCWITGGHDWYYSRRMNLKACKKCNMLEPAIDPEVMYTINRLEDEINIYKKAIKNLWEWHQYKDEYVRFLLDGYSTEEFKDISKEYSLDLKEVPTYDHARAKMMIERIIGKELDEMEVAEVLRTKPKENNE